MFRRTWPWLLVACSLALAASWVLWRPLVGERLFGPPPVGSPLLTAGEAEILSLPVSEIRMGPVSLVDAVDELRERSGANLFVSWRSIEAAGFSRDTPITLVIPTGSLRDALGALCAAVGPRVALDWCLDDGVVTLTTRAELQKFTTTRVYDVRDFAAGRPAPVSAADPVPANRTAATASPRVAGQPLEGLSADLMAAIDPPSWEGRAGRVVDDLTGQLIITQTPANQDLIAHRLETLRWRAGLRAATLRAAGLTSTTGLLTVLFRRRITRAARRLARDPHRCPTCAYDLRATPSPVGPLLPCCPECGRPAPCHRASFPTPSPAPISPTTG